MQPLPFKQLATVGQYLQHYENTLSKPEIHTFDGIEIHFSPGAFDHAFTEDGQGLVLRAERAKRMDWIKPALEDPFAALYQGTKPDKRKSGKRVPMPHRRVVTICNNFLVVVEMKLRDGSSSELKGEFVTCYPVTTPNSLRKLRDPKITPLWTKSECLKFLK